jgi:hypothetical protein
MKRGGGKKGIRSESGQAVSEYIILLAIVTSLVSVVLTFIKSQRLQEKIVRPIREDFRRAYQYGHPKAMGPDEDGGPKYHPRIDQGEGGFRIFLNPQAKGGKGG